MRVHLIGVCGTGMGSLAMLFREAGHEVSGSDGAFDPPMGPALQSAGVICRVGFDAAHLSPAPDLVVVGNAIRRDRFLPCLQCRNECGLKRREGSFPESHANPKMFRCALACLDGITEVGWGHEKIIFIADPLKIFGRG